MYILVFRSRILVNIKTNSFDVFEAIYMYEMSRFLYVHEYLFMIESLFDLFYNFFDFVVGFVLLFTFIHKLLMSHDFMLIGSD